jgi:hypothetical protein
VLDGARSEIFYIARNKRSLSNVHTACVVSLCAVIFLTGCNKESIFKEPLHDNELHNSASSEEDVTSLECLLSNCILHCLRCI